MIYEYNCVVCNHTFEAEQSIKDVPLSECPRCLVCSLNRLVSGGLGFMLKGEGWSNDLYSPKKNVKG